MRIGKVPNDSVQLQSSYSKNLPTPIRNLRVHVITVLSGTSSTMLRKNLRKSSGRVYCSSASSRTEGIKSTAEDCSPQFRCCQVPKYGLLPCAKRRCSIFRKKNRSNLVKMYQEHNRSARKERNGLTLTFFAEGVFFYNVLSAPSSVAGKKCTAFPH